jgi:hypothetical protein
LNSDLSETDAQWADVLERFRAAWAEAERAFAASESPAMNRGRHRFVGGNGLHELIGDDDRERWHQSHYHRFLACLRSNGALYGACSWLGACDAALAEIWRLSNSNQS